MSTWKNRLRSSSSCPNMADNSHTNDNMDNFKLNFLESLSDDSIVKKYQEILAPLFKPLEIALKSANAEIAQLKTQMAEKDATISALPKKVHMYLTVRSTRTTWNNKAEKLLFGCLVSLRIRRGILTPRFCHCAT